MDSLIILSGTASSLVPQGEGMRFTLRNKDGVFSVHVSAELTPMVRQVLGLSTEIYVIGRPKTFFQRQRGHLFLVHLASCFAARPNPPQKSVEAQ